MPHLAHSISSITAQYIFLIISVTYIYSLRVCCLWLVWPNRLHRSLVNGLNGCKWGSSQLLYLSMANASLGLINFINCSPVERLLHPHHIGQRIYSLRVCCLWLAWPNRLHRSLVNGLNGCEWGSSQLLYLSMAYAKLGAR